MNYRSNSILAHIPQNRDGERILKQALFFTNALDMRIFLLDVIKTGSRFLHNPKSKKNQIRHRGALNRFTEFVKKSLDSDIPNNIILRIAWGKIVTNLISESEHGGYEFVLLDKSEHNNSEKLTINDIDKFVSKSFCPVLTIHKDHPTTNIKNIVIPIDISLHTKKKLYWATFFAQKFKATIHIVSALNVNIEERKSLAYKNADKIKKMLQERGVKCDVEIIKVYEQEKHKAVLQYVEKTKADMIIMRTHQELRFTGKKIGKFVSEIIHGCTIPVLTVGGVTQSFDMHSK
ncbi:universal stress protein [uncultured Draconibacterium sp.]|uniref:universal stress protein n=1 Tax=uncultured Draconibacterium sp. TaxID=1573823 RepID=UPI003260E4BD